MGLAKFPPILAIVEAMDKAFQALVGRSDCRALDTTAKKSLESGSAGTVWKREHRHLMGKKVPGIGEDLPDDCLLLLAGLILDGLKPICAGIKAWMDLAISIDGRHLWPVIVTPRGKLAVIHWDQLVGEIDASTSPLGDRELRAIGPVRLIGNGVLPSYLPSADVIVFIELASGDTGQLDDYVTYELNSLVKIERGGALVTPGIVSSQAVDAIQVIADNLKAWHRPEKS